MSSLQQARTAAPELVLGPEHDTEYGFRQEGLVLNGDAAIPITVRTPEYPSGRLDIFANGWTGDKNSMRIPAIETAFAGHTAVTFGYTNLGVEDPLGKNAEDMVAVASAFSEDLEKHATGLSMGGWVTLEAMKRMRTPFATATLIASAGFTSRTPTTGEVILHLGAEIPELAAKYIQDPIGAAKVALAATRHVARRRRAIGAEIDQLTHGSAHHIVDHLQARDKAPFIRYAFGENDKLIPAHEQRAGIQGVDFHQVLSYRGGHIEAVFNGQLTRELLELGTDSSLGEGLAMAA